MKCLFITSRSSLEPEGGGVQRCTREYIRTLQEAGLEVTTLEFKSDMRWFVRIRRKLHSRPYHDCLEAGLGNRVVREIARVRPDWIFFNHCDGLPIVGEIVKTARDYGVRLGYLSHGLDSTDFLHYQSPNVNPCLAPNIGSRIKRKLGMQLFAERSLLQRMDLTCCLAPTDVEIHRWLGADRVLHLPRVIAPIPLDWQPTSGRVGTIASLMHAPNYHGIVQLCEALTSNPVPNLQLRIVGRPDSIGQRLARDFSFVEYLGGLSDAEVVREAATWAGFVNPIFSYPRGCSTKLSVPLDWQIPVFTSRAGARGYYWDESLVPLSDSPMDLAKALESSFDLGELAEIQRRVKQLSANSPTWASVGATLRNALLSTPIVHSRLLHSP